MAFEKNAEIVPFEEQKRNEIITISPVTKAAVEELKNQRALLREFVSSQLIEADFSDKNAPNFGEGDFGVIPGTKKRSLFKQGAEKLQKLFRLGCKFHIVDKEIDKSANFAMFTYKAEVFDIKSGALIAECEASANSQEVKYKERTKWIKKKRPDGTTFSESILEETPIFDIMNTLQKMAQKRAMIGATLLATGASEYFSQDMLDPDDLTDEPKQKQESKASDAANASTATPPMCCDQEMFISKYVDKEFGHAPYYCIKCRTKKSAVNS